jgi:hypothetical protein
MWCQGMGSGHQAPAGRKPHSSAERLKGRGTGIHAVGGCRVNLSSWVLMNNTMTVVVAVVSACAWHGLLCCTECFHNGITSVAVPANTTCSLTS